MRFDFKVTGDPVAQMLAEVLAAEIAVTRGVRAAGEGVKKDWRAQVRGALGHRIAGAIKARTYPETGESISAASIAYAPSKRAALAPYKHSGEAGATAADVIDAHDRGALIRSSSGFYLAIPLAEAGMRGADTTGRGDRSRITPGGWERRTGRRLMPIVDKATRRILLVDDGRLAPGNQIKWRGGRGGGRYVSPAPIKRKKPIPIFLLVPQVRLRKKTDLDRDADLWGNRLPGLILGNWKEPRLGR